MGNTVKNVFLFANSLSTTTDRSHAVIVVTVTLW